MNKRSRREFLGDVGRGMVVASVGASLAADLGFSPAFAQQGSDRLTFGAREPLVSLMQETPAARLQPILVDRLKTGTALRDLVAAAALANARAFGGEDYIGFHTLMAIAPAFHMSGELPEARRALPVLKVLYRNATRIQEHGGTRNEVLRPVQPATLPEGNAGEALRDSVRRRNVNEAEGRFARLASGSAEDALNNLLYTVQDGNDVHRIVLPYRAWDLTGIIGQEQAHTLLRQSVRFCIRQDTPQYAQSRSGMRAMIPRVLQQHRLEAYEPGRREADDAWVQRLSETIFRGTPAQAADAVGAALAEGFTPNAISEAISLAANQLVLRDNGRPNAEGPNKPAGSIHGDGIGVHACDSANAWRNLARVSNNRNKAVCLILGAYQVAEDRPARGGDFLNWQPYPREAGRNQVRDVGRDALLPALNDAIRNRDQARACALVHRYGELGLPARPVWDMLLGFAISEDGALHAEKYYRTTSEEFAVLRPAFRWRQLIALARVTASEFGYAAPGHADACRLLEVG
jgi:hypothetical protein